MYDLLCYDCVTKTKNHKSKQLKNEIRKYNMKRKSNILGNNRNVEYLSVFALMLFGNPPYVVCSKLYVCQQHFIV